MNLLYIALGDNINIHLQATCSIYSFWAQGFAIQSINIITNRPGYYTALGDRLNVLAVSDAELADWEGEAKFFWRIKIKAIEKVCALYPGQPVAYFDTDTILYKDGNAIQQAVLQGTALMHENEGRLSEKKSKTEKRMWQQIAGKEFGGILMQPDTAMWNAGVVITPNTKNNKESLLALDICDAMCKAGVTRRLIEQFSLSVALENLYGLTDLQNSVAHYWSAKDEWNRLISGFFMEAYLGGWSVANTLERFKQLPFHSIPVKQRVRNTNTRLKNMADNLYPAKELIYLPQ